MTISRAKLQNRKLGDLEEFLPWESTNLMIETVDGGVKYLTWLEAEKARMLKENPSRTVEIRQEKTGPRTIKAALFANCVAASETKYHYNLERGYYKKKGE